MKGLPLALLLAFAPGAWCQKAPEAPVTSTIPKSEETVPGALPPTEEAARSGSFSADIAAKIGRDAPKFSPPKTTEAEIDERPDLRDLDKPKNTIIRLPQVMVQESKVPVLKERELLTATGKLEKAYKNQPGLRFGSLPFLSNNRIALSMLAEEERLERLSEMTELSSLYLYNDPETGAAMKSVTEQSFSHRPTEWIEQGGSHAEARAR